MRWLVGCVLLVACVQDHYRCEVDTDCNLGDGGRCEANRYCTHFDASCQLTQRSFTEHSDELSNTCFVGEVTPLNMCAPGQPPAIATGCGAKVCATLPACCTTGWSEACVVEAQMQCPEVVCDTRIAITAIKGTKPIEIYDARYDGTTWQVTSRAELTTVAAYLAPAPGTSEPRFAGFVAPPDQAPWLTIESSTGTQTIAVDGTRTYNDLASLDFDRDLRDTLLLDWQDTGSRTLLVQVLKLDTGDSRDIDTGAAQRMAWGAIADSEGFVDGYPDGVAGNQNAYKTLIDSSDSTHSKDRTIDPGVATQFDTFNTTGGGGALHSFTWADLDGDGMLDLIAFGNSIRVHTGTITETPFVDLDCDPPSTGCAMGSGATETGGVAYNAGGVLPTSAGARIVAAPFVLPAPPIPQAHYVYEITVNPDHTTSWKQLTLPPAPIVCVECAIEAIVVRDFNGDGHPDVLAIDNDLNFFMALSSQNGTLGKFTFSMRIMSDEEPYGAVRTSVSGMPR